jgi:transcriptional regulator GlxA family with amidase domain
VRRLGELERWIAENLTADLRVERLAERVGMSPRNFARRYTETRKRTTTRAVDALRVEAARRALEENDDRINEIAERCGFTDEERMRNAFCAAAAASTLESKAAVKKAAALRRFPSIF